MVIYLLLHDIGPFYTTKFSLTNFICQMFSDYVNKEFLICKLGILSKNPNLHGQKTFDIWNLSKKIWSCKRGYILGSFQKRTILHPQRKFPPSTEEEGNHIKNVLNLCRMSIKGKGGLLISSMGGMDIFWNNPFCGNVRKNYCQGIKYHVFLNIVIAIQFCWIKHYCNVEIVSADVIG